MSLRDIFVKNYCQLRILVILIAKLFYEFIQQLVLAASSKCFYYDFSFRFDNCNTKCLPIAEQSPLIYNIIRNSYADQQNEE